jgi:hypothetical protein
MGVPCALHQMGFGCQCVSQRRLKFSITGSPLIVAGLLKGLSRVMGNYHARFLGGLGPVMAPGYPVSYCRKKVEVPGISLQLRTQ